MEAERREITGSLIKNIILGAFPRTLLPEEKTMRGLVTSAGYGGNRRAAALRTPLTFLPPNNLLLG